MHCSEIGNEQPPSCSQVAPAERGLPQALPLANHPAAHKPWVSGPSKISWSCAFQLA